MSQGKQEAEVPDIQHLNQVSFMCRTSNISPIVSHNPEEEPATVPEQAEVPGHQPDPEPRQSLKVPGIKAEEGKRYNSLF